MDKILFVYFITYMLHVKEVCILFVINKLPTRSFFFFDEAKYVNTTKQKSTSPVVELHA